MVSPLLAASPKLFATTPYEMVSSSRVQYSVNAYSFNELLKSGEMTLHDMMDFAAEIGLNAVDLTGYYFEGYPDVPDEASLYEMKKRALKLGLNITWTGVRNNFADPNIEARKADKEIIKNWLAVSAKLGASIMRVFPGKGKYDGYTKEEVKKWMALDLKECAQAAKEKGVLIGLQHHNDFLFAAEEVIDMLERVDSDWLGLILDTGSVRQGDPYAEIQKLAPYADYWFVKELVYADGVAEPVNMERIAEIVKSTNYTGYISFESLKAKDPKKVVSTMFKDFQSAYHKS